MKSSRPTARLKRKSSSLSGNWSVVRLDATSIRSKARRDYERVLRDMESAKLEAERFEHEDKPRFAKWMNSHCGALLTEIRELQEKLVRAQDLVNEVQQEFYYGNYRSITSAYAKVMRRRNEPELPQPEKAPPEDDEAEFRREFEDAFGEVEDEFWSKLRGDAEERAQQKRSRKSEAVGGLKDLYRRLVRRLHPDKGGERSAREIEWWHQAQDAYQTGNVQQLQLILSLVETEERGSKDAPVSVLLQLTAEFKKSLRGLKRKLAGFKRDIAWNFSRLTDLSALLERTEEQLKADRDEIVWLLAKYERQIHSWETSTVATARGRARPHGRFHDEEWV